MNEQRSFGPAMYDGGEVKSALAEMLKKSLPPVTASDINGGVEGARRSSATATPTKGQSPSKGRSLSDSTPKLSPSPKIKESSRKAKDDHTLPSSSTSVPPGQLPRTPRHRPEFLVRGLSLQMPPREYSGLASPTSNNGFRAPPLSPRVEKKDIYGSPASVLPRHSRGLDFARACTNLHHSTLAEASPDSSPTITQKGMMIPGRKMSVNAMAIDPPAFGQWSSHHAPASERSVISSSLGSVKMLESDSTTDSDDELEPMDPDEAEDVIVNTPQVMKRHNPSATTPYSGPGGWAAAFSPGSTNFPNFHRARLRNGRSRKSSSSASGHSSLASPAPQSPPAGKMNVDGYFGREAAIRGPASRRESLSIHTHDLHISSGNDSGDEASRPPATPGVIRRAVTRRGNLLPKTRAFGRIRADLMEETMPVDAEVKREAEVIRQVRESDDHDRGTRPNDDLMPNSSPTMQAVDSLADALQGIPEDSQISLSNASRPAKGLFGTFARQSSSGNGGKEFWNTFESTNPRQTPPPPSFLPPRLDSTTSSSAMSDDISMDSPATVTTPVGSVFPWAVPSREAAPSSSRASTPQASAAPPTALDGIRKANKRRRDDDLDGASMKRRAVSPGVSVGNSPILSQSPRQNGGASDMWGQPLAKGKETEKVNGNGNGGTVMQTTPLLGPKRVGLQGMNDVQGMAEKMSIE